MSQPSGWYDDPQDPDYLRYFDGVEWTDHRAPRKAPQLEQQPAPPATGASPYVAGQGQQGSPHRAPGHQVPPQQVPPQQWAGAAGTGSGAPWSGGPTTEDGQLLASWGRRAGALILDGLLLSLVLAPFLGRLMPDYYSQVQSWVDTAMAGNGKGADAMPLPSNGEALRMTLTMVGIFLVYEVGMLATLGRTVGRVATGISVRCVEAPRRAPVSRLVLRTLVKRLGDLIPGGMGGVFTLLNYLFPLWDRPLRQALHDKAGRTCVVRGRLPRA